MTATSQTLITEKLMPIPPSTIRRRRAGIRLAAALACCLCFAANDGNAQFVVFDPQALAQNAIGMAQNAAQWAKEAAQWAQQKAQWVEERTHRIRENAQWLEQAAHWKQQIEQWQQQFFTMLNVVQAGPSFIDASTLRRRDVNYGVDQECPQQSGSIAEQQREFCRLLVQIENRRYNVLVDLNHQIAKRNDEMKLILAKRIAQAFSSDLGGLRAFEAEVQTFEANIDHDMNNARAALDQYASLAQATREQQARLSRQAMRSANVTSISGVIGVAVQGAVLMGALEAAKRL